MKRMSHWLAMVLVGVVAPSTPAALPSTETFDSLALGPSLVTLQNGWQASTSAVLVVAAPTEGGSARAVNVNSGVLSNNVDVATPGGVVWTEFHMVPVRGDAPQDAATNVANHIQYVGTNGHLWVYTRTGYVCASNDIHGQPLTAISTTLFSRISIYQNFGSTTSAVLLNGAVVLQDITFPGTSTAYRRFRIGNQKADASFFDSFSASTALPVSDDGNLNGMPDAQELDAFGYVARRLTVGESGAEHFSTLAAAAGVARARDVLIITNVTGALGAGEAAVFNGDVTLTGQSFTNSGAITVAAGATLTLLVPVLEADGLVVSGAVEVASGTSVNVAEAVFGGAGVVSVSNGAWSVDAPAVALSGTFTINGDRWGDTASASLLDYGEDFEQVAVGTTLSNLWFRGWGATLTASAVVASPVAHGVRAASVTGVVSNRVNGAGEPKVWTDVWLRPAAGAAPTVAATNTAAFVFYVGTNGSPVYFVNGWHEILTNAVGGAITPMATDRFARVTMFANYNTDRAALFLNGTLLVERVSFPLASAPAYGRFTVRNADSQTVFLDDLRITRLVPADLVADIDGDTRIDAVEIHNDDAIGVRGFPGSLIRFR